MGIINATPDSYFAESRKTDPDAALECAAQMILDGASILDVGGQSTRPGAKEVGPDEELERLMPVFRVLRKAFPGTILSVDTFHPEVADVVLAEGADIINDIKGATSLPLLECVAKAKAGYVLMHIQGEPSTMQKSPSYQNARSEVFSFLESTASRLVGMGITKIFLDPGFGFGKTIEHNYELLAGLNKLSTLPFPVLTGISRKSMVTRLLDVPAEESLIGSSVLHWVALEKGAKVLRVHDVKAAAQVIKIHNFMEEQKHRKA